jgi:hypothetical protein
LFIVLLTIPSWAGCGEAPAPQAPPQAAPPASAEAPAAPAASDPAPAATPEQPAPPPAPPKPGKEKIVGKWQFSFEGDPKAKADEAAKKKFPKEKDQAKRDAFVQKIADDAAGEWIEFGDGYYVSHTTPKGKDKVVLKVKYDIGSDDSTKIAMKPVGEDEVSKKQLKDVEFAITFTDDNTIAMVDPKKNMMMVFKRK